MQSKDGYNWFIKQYPSLLQDVPNNYYAVPINGSLIDGRTYIDIMRSSGLPVDLLPQDDLKAKFTGLETIIKVEEKKIDNVAAKNYFTDLLSDHCEFDTEINLIDRISRQALLAKYDFVIDCTWGQSQFIDLDIFYEGCIYFCYKAHDVDFAITIMDGNFFSIYPYSKDEYSLTCVEHTPIFQSTDIKIARHNLEIAKQDQFLIAQKRGLFEQVVLKYYPSFLDNFEYIRSEFSMKTKIVSECAYRGTTVINNENLITVLSGKIDTIYVAEKEILGTLKIE